MSVTHRHQQKARHLNLSPFVSQHALFLNTWQSTVPATQLHPFATGGWFSSGAALSA
jgi:hypothetical protein